MSKTTFPETTGQESLKPEASGSRSSSDMRNALSALFQGDHGPLRPRAQDTPDLTIKVNPALLNSFYSQVWQGTNTPLSYAGGNSPALVAPSANPRIDLLTIDSSGTLAWTAGSEGASPTPPNCPASKIPICYVYCKTTMDRVLNYEDKDVDATEGYIYKDVRPFINLGGGLIINTLTEKTVPVGNDLLIIEDSENGNAQKKLKYSNAIPIDTDNTLSANSDTKVASQKATKYYVDNKALADASVSQAKLKTTTGEVSVTTTAQQAVSEQTLPGGEYGFYPQVKAVSTGSTFTAMRVSASIDGVGAWTALVGSAGNARDPGISFPGSESYTTRIHLAVGGSPGGSGATIGLYAQQRYVTASGRDHWIFLLVAKKDFLDIKKGTILSSYQAPDHPCANQGGATPLEIQHPFTNYDSTLHEIILVDNAMLEIAKTKITRQRSLLQIINEDFLIDDTKRPAYIEREIHKINEFPADPIGQVIARMKTPAFAKILIQANEITLEKLMVAQLPDNILYKAMALK